METNVPKDQWGVHSTHCCSKHGCKYGDNDCPVVLELVEQAYPCEWCREEENEILNHKTVTFTTTNLEEIKFELISKLCSIPKLNNKEIAKMVGLSERTLYRYMVENNIKRKKVKKPKINLKEEKAKQYLISLGYKIENK